MVGSEGDYSCHLSQSSHPTFAETIKFGTRHSGPPTDPPATQGDSTPLPSALLVPDPQINKDSSFDPCFETPSCPLEPSIFPPPISNNMDELVALCLLGQIWGNYMALPAIIHKTKSD